MLVPSFFSSFRPYSFDDLSGWIGGNATLPLIEKERPTPHRYNNSSMISGRTMSGWKRRDRIFCVGGTTHNNRCELFVFIVRLKLVLDCFRVSSLDYGHKDLHFIVQSFLGVLWGSNGIWGGKENGRKWGETKIFKETVEKDFYVSCFNE